MESEEISICIVFDALRRVGRQTERWTGARAGGRTGSNVTGQLMTLIYHFIFMILLPNFLEFEPICYTSGPHYLYD